MFYTNLVTARRFGAKGMAAVLAALMCILPASANSQSTPLPTAAATAIPTVIPSPSPITGPALQIAVVGLRNDQGRVSCDLFNEPKNYPRGEQFRHVWAPIARNSALCVFTDVPAGRYAMVVYHDENSNGHFDQNAFGMPMEGYGFSNNAAPLFDAPTFDAASFTYDGHRLYMVIDMRY